MSQLQQSAAVKNMWDNNDRAWCEGVEDRRNNSHTCPYDRFEQTEQYAAWLGGYRATSFLINIEDDVQAPAEPLVEHYPISIDSRLVYVRKDTQLYVKKLQAEVSYAALELQAAAAENSRLSLALAGLHGSNAALRANAVGFVEKELLERVKSLTTQLAEWRATEDDDEE